ncbi:condensation domain-containing protein [Nonomuraea sp. NPDC052265]|uniref:condensation domain-containing protein n=1 Tax=Nonomuraea sp. NPDC052265 TaxID=3364374 RepID=UPI0037C7BB07
MPRRGDHHLRTPGTGRELSAGQEALWFVQQLYPDCAAYNMGTAVAIHSPLDVEKLAGAAALTVRSNDVLRSVFRLVDGEVRRLPVDPDGDLQAGWDIVDATDLDESSLRDRLRELSQRPFRLDHELPIRFCLLRRRHDHVLLINAHHMVVDDVGLVAVVRQALSHYAGEPVDEESETYDDFVARQRDSLTTPRARAAEAYWRAELADLTAPAPFDRWPRPADYRYEGAELALHLPDGLTAAIRSAAAAENVTAFVYLMAAFQVMIHRLTGKTDILIGCPVSQRSARRFAASVGYFVNALPMRSSVGPSDTFEATLRRTGDRFWRGMVHRDYPAALIPRLVGHRPDRRLPGMVTVMFGADMGRPADPLYGMVEPGRRGEFAGLELSHFDFPDQLGQFDLNALVVRQGGTRVRFKYNTSVFTSEAAGDLADMYYQMLEKAARGARREHPVYEG